MASRTTIKTPAGLVGTSVRPPPRVRPTTADPPPSNSDMGEDDVGNIIYINLVDAKIPDKFNTQITNLTQMLETTAQWATIQAGQQTSIQLANGSLPSDSSDASQWKRSDYRAKVIDILFNNSCAWMFASNINESESNFTTTKDAFHLELGAALISGLAVPTSVAASIEGIFQGLNTLITDTQTTANNHTIYTLFQVFTYDTRLDSITGSLRSVSYKINQDMINVVVGKSTTVNITVDFTFTSTDFTFNEDTWNDIKKSIESWIDEIAVENINKPITVPISVD